MEKQPFDPETFDWEALDKEFELEIKKLQLLEKQIDEERQQEHELVSKMTREERLQYMQEKYERVNSYGREDEIKTTTLEPKKKGD